MTPRLVVCLVAICLALPVRAQDQAVTTRELYSDCSAWRADGTYAEKDRGRAFYCTGYLRGAWEAMQEMAFCSGELVHIDRLLTTFKRVAEENPQSMDKPAAWAVYAAFKLAYPCAAQAPAPKDQKKPSTPL